MGATPFDFAQGKHCAPTEVYMKIRMKALLVRKSGILQIGQEVDLPEWEAQELIQRGQAEPVSEQAQAEEPAAMNTWSSHSKRKEK
jgi:hypothetical protein